MVFMVINHRRLPFIARGLQRWLRNGWYRSQVPDPELPPQAHPLLRVRLQAARGVEHLPAHVHPRERRARDDADRSRHGIRRGDADGTRARGRRPDPGDRLSPRERPRGLSPHARFAAATASTSRPPTRPTASPPTRASAFPSLPNHFMMFGPYGWTGGTWHQLVETTSAHILRVIAEARRRGAAEVEVTQEATDRWTAFVARTPRALALADEQLRPRQQLLLRPARRHAVPAADLGGAGQTRKPHVPAVGLHLHRRAAPGGRRRGRRLTGSGSRPRAYHRRDAWTSPGGRDRGACGSCGASHGRPRGRRTPLARHRRGRLRPDLDARGAHADAALDALARASTPTSTRPRTTSTSARTGAIPTRRPSSASSTARSASPGGSGVEWIPNLSPALPLIPTPARAPPAARAATSASPARPISRWSWRSSSPSSEPGSRTVMISFDDVTKVMTHPEDLARYGAGDAPSARPTATSSPACCERLRARRARRSRLLTVGADYSGTADTAVPARPARDARPGIEVMWTGTGVPSRALDAADARAYGDADRPQARSSGTTGPTTTPPGNATPARHGAHLPRPLHRASRPTAARGRRLLPQPANEADLNLLPLATAGDWMRDPRPLPARAALARGDPGAGAGDRSRPAPPPRARCARGRRRAGPTSSTASATTRPSAPRRAASSPPTSRRRDGRAPRAGCFASSPGRAAPRRGCPAFRTRRSPSRRAASWAPGATARATATSPRQLLASERPSLRLSRHAAWLRGVPRRPIPRRQPRCAPSLAVAASTAEASASSPTAGELRSPSTSRRIPSRATPWTPSSTRPAPRMGAGHQAGHSPRARST